MKRNNLLTFLLLIATTWAEESSGSLFSRFDDGREEFLSGAFAFRFADLGTFSPNKDTNIFIPNAKIRPGEKKAYKAKFTGDVTKAVVGVEFFDDKHASDIILEVNMDNDKRPRLQGNVNTDTQCREEKVLEESVVCSFDTSSRGEGTLYIWLTGRRFTTYNMYVVQDGAT